MARATDADVRAYVEMLAETSTAPYIATAEAVMGSLLPSSGLSETILTQIEIFLAAHFATLAVERGGLVRESQGDAAQSYHVIHGRLTGLNLTRFGQQAIALDTTGVLAGNASTNLKATFRVVGSATVTEAS